MAILKQGPSLGRPVKRELVWSNNPILRRLEELQDTRTKEVFTSFLRSYSGPQRSIARSALLKLGYKPAQGTADEAAFEMVSAISGDRSLSEIIMSYGSPAIERIIEALQWKHVDLVSKMQWVTQLISISIREHKGKREGKEGNPGRTRGRQQMAEHSAARKPISARQFATGPEFSPNFLYFLLISSPLSLALPDRNAYK